VAWMLDLGPVVRLQKQMWRIAFFTGLGVYLQAVLTLVLANERSLSPAALALIVVILIAQLILIYRPSRQLAHGQLARRHRIFIVFLPVFVATAALGSPAGEKRLASAIVAGLVAAIGAWAAAGAIRVAGALGPQLGVLRDRTVLVDALSFIPRDALSARLRSFGGERSRWAIPFLAAVATVAGVAATVVLLTRAFGVDIGALTAQISTLVAVLVFYTVMRRIKLSASQLRERDRRAPVLILRQFGDDFLESGKVTLGAAPTFEHFVAAELNRIGPVVAIGRPGERLQPLGASREYLEGPDWRRAVGTAIVDAGLVVFVLGDSESVLWEFRTTIETRGKACALIVVPPLPDRAELGRRWARFVEASEDLLGPRFPRELPERSVLAITFIGEAAVVAVNDERPRSRAMLVRSRSDYRLLFRLFECLRRQELPSTHSLEAFLERTMPMVRMSDLTGSREARP
jgi:hypothetical protein